MGGRKNIIFQEIKEKKIIESKEKAEAERKAALASLITNSLIEKQMEEIGEENGFV